MCFTLAVASAVGSQVVFTSSSFDMNEAQQRTLSTVDEDGRCAEFDTPLAFEHMGETRYFAGRPVEMRAEVGLLSRNVVVQGNDMSPLDRQGGHIMLYSQDSFYRNNSLVGRIQDVELRCMGQAFQLGRCEAGGIRTRAAPYQRPSLAAVNSMRTCATAARLEFPNRQLSVLQSHW